MTNERPLSSFWFGHSWFPGVRTRHYTASHAAAGCTRLAHRAIDPGRVLACLASAELLHRGGLHLYALSKGRDDLARYVRWKGKPRVSRRCCRKRLAATLGRTAGAWAAI